MHQYFDTNARVLIGLIAANVGFFTLLFYHPKDVLPNSYDLLKWLAALLCMTGILILSTLAAPLIFILLGIIYFIAYTHCVKDIPASSDRDEQIVVETFLFPAIAVITWFIAGHSSLSGILLVAALAGYFVCRFSFTYRRAQTTKDSEQKQNFISYVTRYFYPLSAFLSRYDPDCYPPPINRRIRTAIALYAQFIRDLDRANGKPPKH